MTTAIVLADTHVRAGGKRQLPAAVFPHLEEADVILHAGDLVTAELLDQLSAFAPVEAVLGNNDIGLAGRLPETALVDLDGVTIGLVHDAGPRKGRAARLHRRFGPCDVVVFGHSHLPCDDLGIDGQRLFNPGSATWKRTAPRHTIGRLETTAGRLSTHRIVPID